MVFGETLLASSERFSLELQLIRLNITPQYLLPTYLSGDYNIVNILW